MHKTSGKTMTGRHMPQLSGPELARRIAPLAPEMAVLFVSGYAADDVLGHDSLDPAAAYVQKPFTPDALARKVRGVLDGALERV